MPSLKTGALGDLDHELSQTRRVLERLPDDRFDWRPHPKSWTLGGLATHVATLPLWVTTMFTADEFDVATAGRNVPLASREEILQAFDESAGALRAAFEATGDAALGAPWRLRAGDHVMFTRPRGAVVRSLGINHLIHHRAQLVVYLRLLDVPVPGLYGPSADEGRG